MKKRVADFGSGQAAVDPSGARRRPLYARVHDILFERVRAGVWKAGTRLPSEGELASDLGVHQGTVRKALGVLASERVVVRRQGRGTYVAEPGADEWHFRYFHIYGPDSRQVLPQSGDAVASEGEADAEERARLRLGAGRRVIRIGRTRTRDGRVFIAERIVVPASLFPGLLVLCPIPNSLYDYYQHEHEVMVGGGEERLTAEAADARTAALLGVEVGAPLLRIDRVVHDIRGRAVEWRVSLCALGDAYYLTRLR